MDKSKDINIEFLTWLEQQRCYPFEQGWMLGTNLRRFNYTILVKEIIINNKIFKSKPYLDGFRELKLCMKI
jgi:hypothetical protein